MPAILINGMPLTDSEYTVATLRKSLDDFEELKMAGSYFPSNPIAISAAEKFRDGTDKVALVCCDASPFNKQTISHMTSKMLVIVRDPRAILLSALNLFDHQYAVNRKLLKFLAPSPLYTPGYFGWSQEQKIDWLIDNYLPLLIKWINDWLQFAVLEEADAAAGMEIKFVTYEDRVADEVRFFNDIAYFFEFDDDNFDLTFADDTDAEDFRHRGIAEWRAIFTAAQIARCNSKIPRELFQKFGWQINNTPIIMPFFSQTPAIAASTAMVAPVTFLYQPDDAGSRESSDAESSAGRRIKRRRPTPFPSIATLTMP